MKLDTPILTSKSSHVRAWFMSNSMEDEEMVNLDLTYREIWKLCIITVCKKHVHEHQ